MAYFAKLGAGNIVEQIISINNSIITDANGFEQEQLGVDFINNLYGTNDIWKQTSYNNRIRKNYAGIGYTYDENRDAFISPKPFNSWILNEDTCNWESPVSKPELTQEQIDNDSYYKWNEEILNWELING
jgi:hypothetical protein